MISRIFQHTKTYFKDLRSYGYSMGYSMVNFPAFAFRKMQNTKQKKNVLQGFGLYSKPLIVAYSRSGNNWIRYYLEVMTGLRTPGVARHIEEGENFGFDRSHAGYNVMNRYYKVLLILRNYRDCLIRHHGVELIRSYDTISDFLTTGDVQQPPAWYIKNLAAFDEYKGRKLLIYYEDLVLDPAGSLEKVRDFFDLDMDKHHAFLNDLKAHKAQSIKHYEKNKKSMTKGEEQDLSLHSRKLTEQELLEFDAFYSSHYPELTARYLHRYAYDQQ